MSFQQQQSGTSSKQNSPQKTVKDQDAKTSADDEMAANSMDSEGDVAATSSKPEKGGKLD